MAKLNAVILLLLLWATLAPQASHATRPMPKYYGVSKSCSEFSQGYQARKLIDPKRPLDCDTQVLCLDCVFGYYQLLAVVAEVLILVTFVLYTVINTITGRSLRHLAEIKVGYVLFSLLCLHVAVFITRATSCGLRYHTSGTGLLLAALIGFSSSIDAPGGNMIEVYYYQMVSAFAIILVYVVHNMKKTDVDNLQEKLSMLRGLIVCFSAFGLLAWLALFASIRRSKRVALGYKLALDFQQRMGCSKTYLTNLRTGRCRKNITMEELGIWMRVLRLNHNSLYSKWLFWFPPIRALQICHIAALAFNAVSDHLTGFGSGTQCPTARAILRARFFLPLSAEVILLIAGSVRYAKATIRARALYTSLQAYRSIYSPEAPSTTTVQDTSGQSGAGEGVVLQGGTLQSVREFHASGSSSNHSPHIAAWNETSIPQMLVSSSRLRIAIPSDPLQPDTRQQDVNLINPSSSSAVPQHNPQYGTPTAASPMSPPATPHSTRPSRRLKKPNSAVAAVINFTRLRNFQGFRRLSTLTHHKSNSSVGLGWWLLAVDWKTIWGQWANVMDLSREEFCSLDERQQGFDAWKSLVLLIAVNVVIFVTFPMCFAWILVWVLDAVVMFLMCGVWPAVKRGCRALKGGRVGDDALGQADVTIPADVASLASILALPPLCCPAAITRGRERVNDPVAWMSAATLDTKLHPLLNSDGSVNWSMVHNCWQKEVRHSKGAFEHTASSFQTLLQSWGREVGRRRAASFHLNIALQMLSQLYPDSLALKAYTLWQMSGLEHEWVGWLFNQENVQSLWDVRMACVFDRSQGSVSGSGAQATHVEVPVGVNSNRAQQVPAMAAGTGAASPGPRTVGDGIGEVVSNDGWSQATRAVRNANAGNAGVEKERYGANAKNGAMGVADAWSPATHSVERNAGAGSACVDDPSYAPWGAATRAASGAYGNTPTNMPSAGNNGEIGVRSDVNGTVQDQSNREVTHECASVAALPTAFSQPPRALSQGSATLGSSLRSMPSMRRSASQRVSVVFVDEGLDRIVFVMALLENLVQLGKQRYKAAECVLDEVTSDFDLAVLYASQAYRPVEVIAGKNSFQALRMALGHGGHEPPQNGNEDRVLDLPQGSSMELPLLLPGSRYSSS